MFNVTKIRATNGAGKSFYANHLSANDYYSESKSGQRMERGNRSMRIIFLPTIIIRNRKRSWGIGGEF